MTDMDMILTAAINTGLALTSIAFLIIIYRVIKGPTLPDRIVGLDMLVGAAIGFIAILGLKTGYTLYVDIAIALGLVGFLATVAFARFVMSRRADTGYDGTLHGPVNTVPVTAPQNVGEDDTGATAQAGASSQISSAEKS